MKKIFVFMLAFVTIFMAKAQNDKFNGLDMNLGNLYRLSDAKTRSISPENFTGEWNKAKIIVNEGKITVYINDVFQNEATNPVKEGHIGLQSEGKRIKFRNVTLTEQ